MASPHPGAANTLTAVQSLEARKLQADTNGASVHTQPQMAEAETLWDGSFATSFVRRLVPLPGEPKLHPRPGRGLHPGRNLGALLQEEGRPSVHVLPTAAIRQRHSQSTKVVVSQGALGDRARTGRSTTGEWHHDRAVFGAPGSGKGDFKERHRPNQWIACALFGSGSGKDRLTRTHRHLQPVLEGVSGQLQFGLWPGCVLSNAAGGGTATIDGELEIWAEISYPVWSCAMFLGTDLSDTELTQGRAFVTAKLSPRKTWPRHAAHRISTRQASASGWCLTAPGISWSKLGPPQPA